MSDYEYVDLDIEMSEVKMISHTAAPVETVLAVWYQSRPTQYPAVFEFMKEHRRGKVVTAELVQEMIHDNVILWADAVKDLKKILQMPLPILESVHFSWGFAAKPVEWREQAVRKRLWGFWITSMREFSMGKFARSGMFAPPPDGLYSKESILRFVEMMQLIEGFYNELEQEWGWTQEHARKVIPLSATHNGSMFSTLRTLLDTICARSCWIAQLNLWSDVIQSVTRSLGELHPLLGQVVSPPCFDRFSNTYKGCQYIGMNDNRCSGKDPYAPCPLFIENEFVHEPDGPSNPGSYRGRWLATMQRLPTPIAPTYIDQGEKLLDMWSVIWNRDPFTGELSQ